MMGRGRLFRMFHERLGADQDKTLIIREMPGMWHALMTEPGSEKIAKHVTDWLQERS